MAEAAARLRRNHDPQRRIASRTSSYHLSGARWSRVTPRCLRRIPILAYPLRTLDFLDEDWPKGWNL